MHGDDAREGEAEFFQWIQSRAGPVTGIGAKSDFRTIGFDGLEECDGVVIARRQWVVVDGDPHPDSFAILAMEGSMSAGGSDEIQWMPRILRRRRAVSTPPRWLA